MSTNEVSELTDRSKQLRRALGSLPVSNESESDRRALRTEIASVENALLEAKKAAKP
jgi:hypothetical protein